MRSSMGKLMSLKRGGFFFHGSAVINLMLSEWCRFQAADLILVRENDPWKLWLILTCNSPITV